MCRTISNPSWRCLGSTSCIVSRPSSAAIEAATNKRSRLQQPFYGTSSDRSHRSYCSRRNFVGVGGTYDPSPRAPAPRRSCTSHPLTQILQCGGYGPGVTCELCDQLHGSEKFPLRSLRAIELLGTCRAARMWRGNGSGPPDSELVATRFQLKPTVVRARWTSSVAFTVPPQRIGPARQRGLHPVPSVLCSPGRGFRLPCIRYRRPSGTGSPSASLPEPARVVPRVPGADGASESGACAGVYRSHTSSRSARS